MNKPKSILVVDDEEVNREIFQSFLEPFGYEVEVAMDGYDALAKLDLGFDLVILDLMMPGMDGFEVARNIRKDPDFKDLPIIMATSLSSKENLIRALEAGVNDFISKPLDTVELRVRVNSLLKIKETQDALKLHKAKLEEEVGRKTKSLRKSLGSIAEAERKTRQAYLDTIHRLALASEYRDEDTAAHINRISGYCVLLGQSLNLAPGEVENLRYASPMHDVGKIGIPDAILLKPGKLDAKEWEVMKDHSVIGGRILSGSSSELLQAGETIAMSHHEKWDGSGYPNGLEGENIPLPGRICAVADVFDALTTERPYKKAFPNEDALKIMEDGKGKHFDPKVIDAFFKSIEEMLAIQKDHRDGSGEK